MDNIEFWETFPHENEALTPGYKSYCTLMSFKYNNKPKRIYVKSCEMTQGKYDNRLWYVINDKYYTQVNRESAALLPYAYSIWCNPVTKGNFTYLNPLKYLAKGAK